MPEARVPPDDHGSDLPLQDGRFLLVETLGRGAMGTVYRAFDREAERLVALKVSFEPGPVGPAHPLAAEFDVASRLAHPALVPALELACARRGPFTPGTPYLVLEHADGQPADRALRPGHVDGQRLRLVAERLLLALDHLHGHGFVHRDVKPANVLVARPAGTRPEVRLTDFGLAVVIGTARGPGRLSGSLPYLAPETLLGLGVDGRTDLYALGLSLYQLASGGAPVAAPDPEAWVRWHLDGPPVDLARARPDLDVALVELVRSLTARDPARRPAGALEALGLLGVRAPATAGRRAPARGCDRARLRLALDAARLGAVRLYRLPADRAVAQELLRELTVWAQVRGLDVHDLPGPPAAFARVMLRIATDRGRTGTAALRKHGLEACLPFEWVGGVALVEPRRGAPQRQGGDEASRRIEAFLLACAARRPLVLTTSGALETGSLAARVVRRLVRLSTGPLQRPGAGGMLIVAGSAMRASRSRLSA
jgi:hypothetical protein